MEYIHGVSLRQVMNTMYRREKRLPLEHAVTIMVGVLAGLAHAHRATDCAGKPMGVVHRDLSPSNILLSFDGDSKVVDFGIATFADQVERTLAGVADRGHGEAVLQVGGALQTNAT